MDYGHGEALLSGPETRGGNIPKGPRAMFHLDQTADEEREPVSLSGVYSGSAKEGSRQDVMKQEFSIPSSYAKARLPFFFFFK